MSLHSHISRPRSRPRDLAAVPPHPFSPLPTTYNRSKGLPNLLNTFFTAGTLKAVNDYADTSRPWQQRDDEPEKIYRAFLCWRDLPGDRTILGAYRDYVGNKHAGQVPASFRDWYNLFDWHKRSLEWDRFVQRRKDEAHLSAREKVASQRGKSLADLETRHIEMTYDTIEALHEKLQDEEFHKAIGPQQLAPIMRATNEMFKTLAIFRNLRDEAGARTTTAPPLSEETMRILFEDFDYPETPEEKQDPETEE
jgi:hypothetical protein